MSEDNEVKSGEVMIADDAEVKCIHADGRTYIPTGLELLTGVLASLSIPYRIVNNTVVLDYRRIEFDDNGKRKG